MTWGDTFAAVKSGEVSKCEINPIAGTSWATFEGNVPIT